MIKALIFDMDGTLVDSEKLHYQSWKTVLERHGIPSFSFTEFLDYVGTSNEKIATEYQATYQLKATSAVLISEKQQLHLERLNTVEPMPGSFTVIERFTNTLRLGVASSSHFIELQRILNVLGLEDIFEHVIGGDMITHRKPHPEIYQRSCALFDLPPEQCVAIEDTEPGITAAKEAGLYAIAIPNTLSKSHDFSKADKILNRIDQIDHALITGLTA